MEDWWKYTKKCDSDSDLFSLLIIFLLLTEGGSKNSMSQELEEIKQELKEIKLILASK